MKHLLILIITITSFTSCKKKSIVDAMLESENNSNAANTNAALFSFEANGASVSQTVKNPDKLGLSCVKTIVPINNNAYVFGSSGIYGNMDFIFYTDSLKTRNYKYLGSYGPMFIMSYTGKNYYAKDVKDSMSFNITSYNNGYISGNFSGRLTELISQSSAGDVYGTPGSLIITKGSFNNVMVFYQ